MAKQAKKKPPLAERVAKLEKRMDLRAPMTAARGYMIRDVCDKDVPALRDDLVALQKHVDDGFQAHRESVCGQTSGHKWAEFHLPDFDKAQDKHGHRRIWQRCACGAVRKTCICDMTRRERRRVRKALGL